MPDTKSQRKLAHRRQGAAQTSPAADAPSPTVDALWALVEAYASRRSVNINGPYPALEEAKASLQGALRVLVAEATSRPQLHLPKRKTADCMSPGDSEERYAAYEGRVEGWNECLEEISRLNSTHGRTGAYKLVPMELPQDVQHAAAIWESMGVKKTYAELWQFMLSKLPGVEVSGG